MGLWVRESGPDQEMPAQSLAGWVGVGQENKDIRQGISDRAAAC